MNSDQLIKLANALNEVQTLLEVAKTAPDDKLAEVNIDGAIEKLAELQDGLEPIIQDLARNGSD